MRRKGKIWYQRARPAQQRHGHGLWLVGGARVRVSCQSSNGGFQYSLCERSRQIRLWILLTKSERTRNKELQLGTGGLGSGVIDATREACFVKMESKTVCLKALVVEDINVFGVRLKAVDRRFHCPRDIGAFLIVS